MAQQQAPALDPVTSPEMALPTRQHLRDPWALGVFVCALAVALGASLLLIARIGTSGDEPWYLLQGYNLLRFHTADVARSVQDPTILRQFVGSLRDDHTMAVPGGSARVLPYLPGYAALVGPLYLLGGRALVVMAQAVAGAGVAALLFAEARRLLGSRAAGLFAALAYVTGLPALLYVGETVPSTIATLAAFVAYLLVARALPAARGARLVIVCAAIGVLALALPWLHVKYAPLAVVIAGAAGLHLLRRAGLIHWPMRGLSSAPSPDAQGRRGAREHSIGLGLMAVVGLPLLGFALIALYSHHYFGTWYPQYSIHPDQAFVARPDLLHMLGLYRQMLLDPRQGLIPWAPLVALAPVGLALLWRWRPHEAALAVAWTLGLLAAFVSSAIAPHVNQAYALPARFTVECQPFFALGAAAIFVWGWPTLRVALRGGIASVLRAPGRWRAAVALGCLALLAADAWLTFVGQLDPGLLYPTLDGSIRILVAHPRLLPGWWFALFGARG